MTVIRTAQRGASASGATVKEADSTLVTTTDKDGERILHNRLGGILGVGFWGEEGSKTERGEYSIMVDPLDGTRAFALRIPTSTVIAALVHNVRGVVACVIGEAASGRIWSATEEGDVSFWTVDASGRECSHYGICSVWKGPLTEQASLFLDVSHGFTRGEEKRPILTHLQVHDLMVRMSSKSKLFMPGSNGLHFALVANGGDYCAGQITTAVGGPWDIAGVLLVQQAGGVARGFRIVKGVLEEVANPRDIVACDIMVSGNSQDTVNDLVLMLQRAM